MILRIFISMWHQNGARLELRLFFCAFSGMRLPLFLDAIQRRFPYGIIFINSKP